MDVAYSQAHSYGVPTLARIGNDRLHERPPSVPALMKRLSSFTMADTSFSSVASPTGPPSTNASRGASPNPMTSPIPNGKPTSPHNERSNPMSPSAQIAAQTVSSKDPKAAAAAASDMRNVVRRKLTGYVGFANLPNQWHRKSVRKGFNFNVMVVGKHSYLIYLSRVETDCGRRIWARKVYFGQYPLQHLLIPSQGAKGTQFGHHTKDRIYPVNQRGYRRKRRSPTSHSGRYTRLW